MERDLGDVPDEDAASGDLTEDVEKDIVKAAEDDGLGEELAAGAAAPPDAGRLADTPAEPVDIGAPSSLDEPVSWELASMTTPDYVPPHSIHDREHDSWPVETDDGDAVPAWTDDAPVHAGIGSDDADAVDDEIGELLLDEVVPADPWDMDSEPEEPADAQFPLDAFIVPAGVHSVTGYGRDDVAHLVALRLDEIARQLRHSGFSALGNTDSVDELSRVLAAIVSGYVARDT